MQMVFVQNVGGGVSNMVVKERVITLYACEYCQRQYIDMEAVKICEKRRCRHADSPEAEQQSEKNYWKLKG